MTKLILGLLAFIAANVMVYLAFAFMAWELDPSRWHQDGRVVFVAFGAMFGVVSALAVKEMK